MNLSKFYKFILVNNTNVTLTYANGARVSLHITKKYITPATGKVFYVTTVVDNFGFTSGTIVDGAEVGTADIDNTSDLYLGAEVQLEVAHDLAATATGSLDLYLCTGPAAGDLQDDQTGYVDAETNGLTIVDRLQWPAGLTNDDVVMGRSNNI